MNPHSPIAEKFISAVQRRILVVRIAESLAITTAIASAAGLLLMPILWLEGKPGLDLAMIMLGLGGWVGLIWGIARRPTKLQAAVEADRQLGLDDLLGTILLLRHRVSTDITPPAWTQAIAAVAESRCRTLRPSAVVVGRLGRRGWGGAGVVAALLLAAGLFTTRPLSVNAASSSFLIGDQPRQDSLAPAAVASLNPSSPLDARPPGPGGTDDISNRRFSENRPDSSDSPQTTATNGADQYSQSASGTGGGAAVTQTPTRRSQSIPFVDSNSDASHQHGPATSGIGPADANAISPGNSDSATVAAAAGSARRPAPWNSDQWSLSITAARQAINSGQVPDSAADLVRDYFEAD